MTKENREPSIKATLKWEGGYSNDAADPGGPTNWGITIADAKKYWKANATAEDVKRMPQDIAVDIYRSKYWKTSYYDCDKLDAGVDLAVFDFGVNSGPSRAKKYLDQSTGGTATETVNKIFDGREKFLRGLSTFPVFGKGWMNRTRDLRKVALAMAGNKPPITSAGTKATAATAAAGGVAWAAWIKFGFIGLGVVGVAIAIIALAISIHNQHKVSLNAK